MPRRMMIAAIVLAVAFPSFSQYKDYALDRYSIDGKRWYGTVSYFKLYKMDSAWLIYRRPNKIMRYVIYDSFKTNFPSGEVLLAINLTNSAYYKREMKEDILVGKDVIIISFRNGNYLWFHIKHKYKKT